MKNDKMKVIMGFMVSSMVLVTLGVYMMNMGNIDLTEIMLIGMVLVLVVSATCVVRDKMRNVKTGLPTEDEMSERFNHKAGYYAYLFSVWAGLGVAWINDMLVDDFGFAGLTVSQTVGAIILLSAAVFIGLMVYYREKGV